MNFDDVHLIPRVISSISSRDEIDISTEFCGIKLKVPIIASPMKDVCDGKMAANIRDEGGFGIIHRFNTIEEQIWEFNECVNRLGDRNEACGCAIGVNGDFEERFNQLYSVGCRIFCIDTANGANINIQKAIEKICNKNVKFIIGNIASLECCSWICSNLRNVWAIRLGISGGSACITKLATGIERSLLTTILDCKSAFGETNPVSLIADGGIRGPADFCKCLGFGANCVMLGSLIANTRNSPAKLLKTDKGLCKVYRGSA